MNVKKRKFGLLSDGKKVSLYTVDNGVMSFSVTDFGCIITSIMLKNRKGGYDDIVVGYSTLDGYINSPGGFFGTIVGRFANRIGGATFSIDGNKYTLDKNDEDNCLHGGFEGYNKMVWMSEKIENDKECGVKFTRLSPDGEQGFPGNVQLEVKYLLTQNNEIIMKYHAETDKATPLNITNHSYFNLKGDGKGSVLEHKIKLNCDSYLEVDSQLIPTGKKIQVKGTAFDFLHAHKIGDEIKKIGGYDHCYCINGNEEASTSSCNKNLVETAIVTEETTGRSMTMSTNQPGVQFYTGNFLDGLFGKKGRALHAQDAFCLETQQFPDAPNKQQFPCSILRPGEKYKATTIYKFTL